MHMEYVPLSLDDILELLIHIMISLIEG